MIDIDLPLLVYPYADWQKLDFQLHLKVGNVEFFQFLQSIPVLRILYYENGETIDEAGDD